MLSTAQRKRVIMVLLIVLGLWGIPFTRAFIDALAKFQLFGLFDVGLIVGTTSLIAVYWIWRGWY